MFIQHTNKIMNSDILHGLVDTPLNILCKYIVDSKALDLRKQMSLFLQFRNPTLEWPHKT